MGGDRFSGSFRQNEISGSFRQDAVAVAPRRPAREAWNSGPCGRDCFVALRAPRNDGCWLPKTPSTSLRAKRSNLGTCSDSTSVMAGLVPAIHAFPYAKQGVDARDKRGHDGGESSA